MDNVDLKQTVNLPKTSFSMKANLPQTEPKVLERWEKDVAHHDYAAATNYLSIRFGEDRAQEVSKKLQKLLEFRKPR